VYKLHQVVVRWKEGPAVVQQPVDEGGTVTMKNNRPAVASVSYQQGVDTTIHQTKHFCRLPETYAIEPLGTPFGTDEASVELNADGSLKVIKQKRDHQIDELVTSVAEGAKTLSGLQEGSLSASNPYSFYPPLPPNAQIIEFLEISPLN